MKQGIWVLLAAFMISAPCVWAHDANKAAAEAAEAEVETVTPEDLIQGVVKIVNTQANVFSAETQSGHGTGFLVSVDEATGKGLLFTNKHVIDSSELQVQSLSVEFNTDQRKPEILPGKLVFVSRLHDFAVVEVDISQLKRAKVRVLNLPTNMESPFFDFVANERNLRGRPVLAIGNPFDGSNITTFGNITGLKFDPKSGPFIQTQTPINPGNSGGPLVSLDTGEVIGINTMIYQHADGVNFSIPIGVLLKEFLLWRHQSENGISPRVQSPRSLGITVKPWAESNVRTLGLHEAIEKQLSGYWDNNSQILMVSNLINTDTPLKEGDVLLTINDEVVGGNVYDLIRLAHESSLIAKVRVLRKGKVVNLKVPVPDLSYDEKRRDLDYVYVSGMLLQEMSELYRSMTRGDLPSSVFVSGVVETADTNFQGAAYPPAGSVIVAVSFGDKEYKVRNLFDLKKAINENRGAKTMVVHAYKSNIYATENGGFVARSVSTGTTLVDGIKDMFILPMRDVLTPMQFSLHQFKRQFSFAADAAETRDWQDFVRRERVPSACATILESKKVLPIAAAKK